MRQTLPKKRQNGERRLELMVWNWSRSPVSVTAHQGGRQSPRLPVWPPNATTWRPLLAAAIYKVPAKTSQRWSCTTLSTEKKLFCASSCCCCCFCCSIHANLLSRQPLFTAHGGIFFCGFPELRGAVASCSPRNLTFLIPAASLSRKKAGIHEYLSHRLPSCLLSWSSSLVYFRSGRFLFAW